MKKTLFACLILALMINPFKVQAEQRQVYPHLQIFLLSSERRGGASFIAFWRDKDQLVAGPFPIRLLELAGLNVFLDLSYQDANEELPSEAQLKITKRETTSSQQSKGPVSLDQLADRVIDRGVSKMFPERPFLVVGHNEPSEGVLWVGDVMREIQNKILACDKVYRKALEATLDSLKGDASYNNAMRVVESGFPSCPP